MIKIKPKSRVTETAVTETVTSLRERVAKIGRPKKVNIAGQYSPSRDAIWSSDQSTTNPVHESLHRGLETLRQSGKISPFDEETMVRAIMQRHFGNIEFKDGNDAGNAQISRAQQMLDPKTGSPEFISALQMLDREAGKILASRLMEGSPDTGYDRR